jgi:hypothetical protein
MTHENIEPALMVETEEVKPKRKRRASKGFGEVEVPQAEVVEESLVQPLESEPEVSSFDHYAEPQPEPYIESVKQALVPKFEVPVRPVISNKGGGLKRGVKRAVNTKR